MRRYVCITVLTSQQLESVTTPWLASQGIGQYEESHAGAQVPRLTNTMQLNDTNLAYIWSYFYILYYLIIFNPAWSYLIISYLMRPSLVSHFLRMSDFWCFMVLGYIASHIIYEGWFLRSIPKGEQGQFQQALGNGSGPVTWAAPPFIEALKDASWSARRVPRTFRRFKLGLFWHLQKPSWKVPLKGAGDFQWPDLARWHHFRMCRDFTAAFFSQQGSWMPPRLATTRPARLAPSWDHWPDLDQWKPAEVVKPTMHRHAFKHV